MKIRDVWVVFKDYQDYDGWSKGSPKLMGVYSTEEGARAESEKVTEGFKGGNTYIRGSYYQTKMEDYG